MEIMNNCVHENIQRAIDTNTYAFSPPEAMTDKHIVLLLEFKMFIREFVCDTNKEYHQLVDWYRTTMRSLSTGIRNDSILVLNTGHDIRRIVYNIFEAIIGFPLACCAWYDERIKPSEYIRCAPSVYCDISREKWSKRRLDELLTIQRSQEQTIMFKYRRWQYTSPIRTNISISFGSKRDDLKQFIRNGFIICNGHQGGCILDHSGLFLKMERMSEECASHLSKGDAEYNNDTCALLSAISFWLINTDDY